jgi:hypothetical protein
MGPVAMANAEKTLQPWQTRAIACGRIVASNLLAQEIHADFCYHPFTQRAVAPILPPGRWRGLVLLLTLLGCLASVQCIASRIARRMAVLSSSEPCPSQQESGDRWQGGRRCFTSQALVLQQLFDALLRLARCASALETNTAPAAHSGAGFAGL